MTDPKPRVLIVVTLAEAGGAQTYARELAGALTPIYDVTLAAHGPGPLAADVRGMGVKFVALAHVRRSISPLADLRGLLELWRLFRELRPSVVHLNSAKAGVLGRLAARLARIPVCVYTVHGWAFKVPGQRAATFYRLLERFLGPLSTLVICVSDRERRAGLDAHACRSERTVVIRNAVRVSASPTRAHEAVSPVTVICVGRLAPPKDVATLISAFSMLPRGSAVLDVVGHGPLRAELVSQAARLGMAEVVRFAGEVDDVATRLARSDIFVLSSRSEGLPISVLEAMAAGLPVVASDVGGIVEQLEPGVSGFLVPPGDPHALAEQLAELIADPSRRAAVGEAARREALERFDIYQWADRHRSVYAALLHDPPYCDHET